MTSEPTTVNVDNVNSYFVPVSPENPAFRWVDRATRHAFDRGLTALRAGTLNPSDTTKALLETLEVCASSFPRPGSSAFVQQGSAVFAEIEAGVRR